MPDAPFDLFFAPRLLHTRHQECYTRDTQATLHAHAPRHGTLRPMSGRSLRSKGLRL